MITEAGRIIARECKKRTVYLINGEVDALRAFPEAHRDIKA